MLPAKAYKALVQVFQPSCLLWRGSLSDRRTVPSDCAAVAKPKNQIVQTDQSCWYGDRFAVQREQAPSPQKEAITRRFTLHIFFTLANHRLSFIQVRSICVNGSVDYGRFVANRFE
ncbi:hypothetical protein EMIT0P258_20303 [Pseudomonas sp. IT-P258]